MDGKAGETEDGKTRSVLGKLSSYLTEYENHTRRHGKTVLFITEICICRKSQFRPVSARSSFCILWDHYENALPWYFPINIRNFFALSTSNFMPFRLLLQMMYEHVRRTSLIRSLFWVALDLPHLWLLLLQTIVTNNGGPEQISLWNNWTNWSAYSMRLIIPMLLCERSSVNDWV